jgi:flagellar basal-body rod protein FlgB
MTIFDGIDRLRTSLDYHLARQNLLTANLSHMDTPGYRPLDLARTGFRANLAIAMRETSPAHLQPGGGRAGEAFRVFEDRDVADGLDGNAVNVDREAVKIASNQLRYDAMAQLTQSALANLLWAANDGRGGA